MKSEGARLRVTLWTAVLGAAAVAAGLRYAVELIRVLAADVIPHDFTFYFGAAQAMRAGEGLYTTQYRYPPTLALLMTPLTLLPLPVAWRLWTLATQAFLLAGMALGIRALPRPLRPTEILATVCLVFSFFPLYGEVKLGQVGSLLLLLTALTAVAWQRHHPGCAAAWVALAGAFKLYPLGMALWFWRQRAARTLVLAFAAFAAILVVPEIVFRRGWLADFVTALPVQIASNTSPLMAENQSFFAFAGRLAFWMGGSFAWGSTSFILSAAAGAATFAAALALSPAGAMRGDILLLSVVAAALPLAWATPVSWTRNFIVVLLAAPPMIQRLAQRLPAEQRTADYATAAAGLFAWILMSQPYRIPRLFGYYPDAGDLPGILLKSTFLYGAVIVWAVILRELRVARREMRARTDRTADYRERAGVPCEVLLPSNDPPLVRQEKLRRR